jgi:hypothetical protein
LATLDVEWAATPELAPGVVARVSSERQPRVVRLPLSRPKRIALITAATVLLLAGAAVAAKIIIDLGAVVVEITPTRPGLLPTPWIAPTGEPITLREAGILLGDVALPPRLGGPDRVWADHVFTDSGKVPRVTMAWRARPDLPEISGTRYGVILMIFEGDANQASKEIYEETGVLKFETVDGVDYYWTTGTHVLQLLTSEGVVYVRVEGNVLLWRDGSRTMRLETALPKAKALRIATSTGTP